MWVFLPTLHCTPRVNMSLTKPTVPTRLPSCLRQTKCHISIQTTSDLRAKHSLDKAWQADTHTQTHTRRHTDTHARTHTQAKSYFTYEDQKTCLNYHRTELPRDNIHCGIGWKPPFIATVWEWLHVFLITCHTFCHAVDYYLQFQMHSMYCSETKLIIRRGAITLTHH